MILDARNVERIENPTAEQVEHYLRFMPPQAPFVILSASEGRFIQAAFVDDAYRVQYREGGRQSFAKVPIDDAVKLFEAYRIGDASFKDAVSWRRLTVLNDPHHPAAMIVLVALMLCGIVFAVWSAFH